MNINNLIALTLFSWTVVDRLIATFGRHGSFKARVPILEKLNSAMMILIYACIAFGALVEMLMKGTQLSYSSLISGILLYVAGRYLRNSAISCLGNHWNIYISAVPMDRIITVGPYEYMRHPYYVGTIFELIGYAVSLNSIYAMCAVLFLFLPLVVVRIFLEEKSLLNKFKHSYQLYKRDTGILISGRRFVRDFIYFRDFTQLISISRKFGVKQLFKIKFMSHAIERYSRGYAVSRLAGSLIEVGLIEELIKNEDVNLCYFAKENEFDLDALRIACDYFAVLGIFKKNGLRYSLSNYGVKLFDYSRGAFTLLYAYMPIFENLPDIIRKKKVYGKNVLRKSEYVGTGSNELAQLLPFPYAKQILEKHKLHRILDLGCGAGDFLIDFCKQNGFFGIGVDLSPEVIAIAQKRAKERGLNNRVVFEAGDILSLDKLSKTSRDVDVLTFMFVLHEFLVKNNAEEVIKIFKNIKHLFPSKHILITEVYKWSVPQLISNPATVAEHHLFHRLSHQGLATFKEWRNIFGKAGYVIVEEKRFDRGAQVYFLLKPGVDK